MRYYSVRTKFELPNKFVVEAENQEQARDKVLTMLQGYWTMPEPEGEINLAYGKTELL